MDIFMCTELYVWQLYSELWAFWVQHRVITGAFRICFECVFFFYFLFIFFKLCRYINKERKTYFTYTHSILTAVADCDWQSWFTVTRCSRLFNLLLCWICHLIDYSESDFDVSVWPVNRSVTVTHRACSDSGITHTASFLQLLALSQAHLISLSLVKK